MSQKMTCPGCRSHSSAVALAYDDDRPCPACGLPADVTGQVLYARQKAADAELTARYEEVVLRVGRAEGEAARLRDLFDQLARIVDDYRGDGERL